MMKKFLPAVCPDCCCDLVSLKDGAFTLIDTCHFDRQCCNNLLERDRNDYVRALGTINAKLHDESKE